MNEVATDLANDLRRDDRDLPWPQRPWLMAALCALAGLLFWVLVDDGDAARGAAAAASGLAVATIALVLTIERRRWTWSIGFALGWGIVIALIAWMAAGYGRAHTVAEWPFFSGIFAVLLAAPLFQAARDHGTLRFPAASAHDHVWTDAVIGAASLAFVGISFALAFLVSSLFNLIGIHFLERLLNNGWFAWMLAGAAFGGSVGLLRERDALVSTLHRLAMVVLSVLAPVLAVALVFFLISLPIAGLSGLWDGWASAAALTLAAGAGGLILGNAAIGPIGADKPVNAAFHWSALALSLTILPLAILATIAMGLRIDQYGWTPERIWGVLAAGVAIAIGLSGWWAVARDRLGFAPRWQQAQVHIGMAVCGIALFLALPIVDFGGISARDQLARLRSGALSAEQFDWEAMAFDFGPAGRAALTGLSRNATNRVHRRLAGAALAAEDRSFGADAIGTGEDPATLGDRLRLLPGSAPVPEQARAAIIETRLCQGGQCRGQWLSPTRLLLVGRRAASEQIEAAVVTSDQGEWRARWLQEVRHTDTSTINVDAANVELRPFMRQRLVVDGRIIGEIPDE